MDGDLAVLLSRNLKLSSEPDHLLPVIRNGQSDNGVMDVGPVIKHSISQHYNHSAHLAHSNKLIQQPKAQQIDELTAEIILARNGVDPSALFPAQLTLFREADVAQQMRLVQLWRIGSAHYGKEAYDLEFGRARAWGRPSELQLVDVYAPNGGDSSPPATQDSQMLGPDANPATDSGTSDGTLVAHLAEPYMISGYEILARRDYDELARQQQREDQKQRGSYQPLGLAVGTGQAMPQHNRATDPVYRGCIVRSTGEEDMAYQYGRFDQLAQFGNPSGTPQGAMPDDDEEML